MRARTAYAQLKWARGRGACLRLHGQSGTPGQSKPGPQGPEHRGDVRAAEAPKRPARHGPLQPADVSPTELPYVPAGQSLHTASPATLYRPAAHKTWCEGDKDTAGWWWSTSRRQTSRPPGKRGGRGERMLVNTQYAPWRQFQQCARVLLGTQPPVRRYYGVGWWAVRRRPQFH